MSNNQADRTKDDLERTARNAANRTGVGQAVQGLKRESKTAQGVVGRVLKIFGRK